MMKSQRLLSYDALVIVVFSERESIGENRENKIERDTIEQLRGIWWTISSGDSNEAHESLECGSHELRISIEELRKNIVALLERETMADFQRERERESQRCLGTKKKGWVFFFVWERRRERERISGENCEE